MSEFPRSPIASTDLRDHASPARLAAVWNRLEATLPSGVSGPTRHSALGGRMLWVSALVGGAFALGVAVGANGLSSPVQRADGELALQPDPRAPGLAMGRPGTTAGMGAPQATHSLADRNRKAHLPRPSLVPAPGELPAETPDLLEQTTPAPATPLWQLAAQQGEYQTALAELEASGGFDTVVGQADADQLMLLADVARATGFRQRAVLAWRRVINQHASDPQAPLAAWSLGNMLEKAGDQAGAADALAAYRALSPQGDFAEDALARQIRMAVTQQDAQLANRLAAQYDLSFPNGRRAQEIREQLATLRGESSVALGNDADAGIADPERANPSK